MAKPYPAWTTPLATMALKVGDSVLDGYKKTESWFSNGISWLEDISEFYKERASIERESSQRLAQLAARFFSKKAAVTAKVSVGDDPVTTPGSLENSSLQTWHTILAQTETLATARMKLAEKLQKETSDELELCRHRFDDLAKNFKKFDDEIGDRLKDTYKSVKSAKHDYDTSCESMESARARNKRSADSKEVDMYRKKNAYIVKINVANRMKDKHFHDDVPQLLDAIQRANEVRVLQTNKLLNSAAESEEEYSKINSSCCSVIMQAIENNVPENDTRMFVEHNANVYAFKDPPDFIFEPSQIWHDNSKIYTGSPDAAKYLQALLNSAYERSSPAAEASQKSLTSFESSQTKCENADFSKLASNQTIPYLKSETNTLRKLVDAESDRLEIEVEIETIEAATAELDMSKIPQTQLKTHRTLFGKKQEVVEVSKSKPKGRTLGLSSLLARASLAGVGGNNRGAGGDSNQKVSVLYDFEAAGVGEISVSAGDTAKLVEPDDGSGWVRIEIGGSQGIVPSTYVQIIEDAPPVMDAAPAPPPARGSARKMEALYAYEAQDPSQLSIQPGDSITVLEPDDGCGWTRGQLNNAVGIFPTSYAK